MRLAPLMAGVALVALMAQPGLAQNQDTAKQPEAMPANQTQQQAQADMDFAKTAAGAGMAEVELGKLAQQEAQSEEVKQFGQRMVDDHTKANDKLKAIAEQKGIDLPQDPPDEAQQAYDDLQEKSGQEFDQAFMDKMVEDHHKAVDLFQEEAKSGKDAELQSFAKDTLPTLKEHLDLAEQTQEQVTAAADEGTGQTGMKPLAATDPAKNDQPAAPPAEQAAAQPMPEPQPEAMPEPPQAMTEPAQQPPATEAEPAEQQRTAVTEPTGDQLRAEEVIGTEVVNTKGDQVGKIKDLVLDQNQVQYAVVSVGGFLGIGDKEVAIPLDQLKLGRDKSYLMTAETEAQLKQMPEYKKGQYGSKG